MRSERGHGRSGRAARAARRRQPRECRQRVGEVGRRRRGVARRHQLLEAASTCRQSLYNYSLLTTTNTYLAVGTDNTGIVHFA